MNWKIFSTLKPNRVLKLSKFTRIYNESERKQTNLERLHVAVKVQLNMFCFKRTCFVLTPKWVQDKLQITKEGKTKLFQISLTSLEDVVGESKQFEVL